MFCRRGLLPAGAHFEMKNDMFSRLARSVAILALVSTGLAGPLAAQTTPGSGGSTPTQTAPATPTPAPAPGPEPQVIPAPDMGKSVGDASTAQNMVLATRPAIVVSGTSEWEQGFAKLNASFADIRAAMAKAGLQPGGKPLAVFTETDDQGFKFEAMIPLAAAPATAPSLPANAKLGQTPAGKVMKFEHRSAYDDIDSTYEAITAYLDEKSVEAQTMFIEEYLTEPKTADDTSLQVDIYVFTR
jgi:effector-binding domain-containing protein